MASSKLNTKFVVIDTKTNHLGHYEGRNSGPAVILEEPASEGFLELFRKDPEKALTPEEPEAAPVPRDWEAEFHKLEGMVNKHEALLVHMLEKAMGTKDTNLDSIQLANEVATRLNAGASA